MHAKPKTPLPDNAYDGGVLSAETLGRGGLFASNEGSMASGSENPAALLGSASSSIYATTYLGETSDVSESVLKSSNPVNNIVLQYLSMGAEKGTLYYEPLGRSDAETVTNTASPTTDFDQYQFSSNAIGFAAGEKYKGGSIGMSLAYLQGSIASTQHQAGSPDQSTLDTGSGVRMNIGLRYPTGPVMWGLVLQNAPGFMWWKHYKRDMLPFKMRIGNTWRVKPGILFSAEAETRYYNEGGNRENFLYFGTEMSHSKTIVLRAGVFSDDSGSSESRHLTGGVSFNLDNNVSLTYALESFKVDDQKVQKSILSVKIPLSFDEVPQ